MSIRKNMATKEQKDELSKKILELKEELGLTYKELNSKLNNPCIAQTLTNLAKHPGKGCSLKLYENVQLGITNLTEYRTKKLELEKIKDEFIYEITAITNGYLKKMEDFYTT